MSEAWADEGFGGEDEWAEEGSAADLGADPFEPQELEEEHEDAAWADDAPDDEQ